MILGLSHGVFPASDSGEYQQVIVSSPCSHSRPTDFTSIRKRWFSAVRVCCGVMGMPPGTPSPPQDAKGSLARAREGRRAGQHKILSPGSSMLCISSARTNHKARLNFKRAEKCNGPVTGNRPEIGTDERKQHPPLEADNPAPPPSVD